LAPFLLYNYAKLKAVEMFAGVSGLDLAIGIRQMLEANGFTSLDSLLKLPVAELALILGIDLYVARLIYLAARKHAEMEKEQFALNDEAFVRLEQKGNKEKLEHIAITARHLLHI
jgi:hypothetical protein